jgi:hypothetical protein
MKSMGDGGRGGIRTHGELAPTAVFKTAALNHSATLPLRFHCYGGARLARLFSRPDGKKREKARKWEIAREALGQTPDRRRYFA